ncbi:MULTISPECIES: hypothetical protein [unclassified Mesorhizobium]|uniref:hypothetical protein n=1 Tax=unclassified Mesorhizobium TaxID=325217 RepID=UPI0007FF8F44|nr:MULTISPECIES: hypothetical protein [unclassified Mesorhizobium]OBQ94409.1 hypothetical protein A9K66_27430 [Mesorhizobium sp. AA23]RUW52996.1 hypothetical protein EOA32_10965 [Mesorhizobium sp. M1A.F.Ca.ET.072.01.1.1]TIV04350.1 MAG: hypothetical protein E5W04_03990 [Mesorhizobium sp.]
MRPYGEVLREAVEMMTDFEVVYQDGSTGPITTDNLSIRNGSTLREAVEESFPNCHIRVKSEFASA